MERVTLFYKYNLKPMKVRYRLLFIFFMMYSFLQAQFPGAGMKKGPELKGKISGNLVDSLSGEPVGYATLSIKKSGSNIVSDGILSEENGDFVFHDVKTGKYTLEISFLGYSDKIISNVETTLRSPDIQLGKIKLVPSNILLDAVEIVEEKTLIENKIDKLVFNAENDASIAGGDASDVLRKVPLLTVDLNGNVSLRGSQNVRILINGKPSGMFSGNVADALKMFPADQIKKVEVITSPSAKYDGEGSAGIINIITKKQQIEGVAGNVNASVGNRQNSLFSNLNAGRGRFGSSLSGAIFYSVPLDGITEFYREDNTPAGIRTISQNGIQETSRLGGNGSVNLFYDFNGFNSLTSSFSVRGFGFDNDGSLNGSIQDPSFGITDLFTRKNTGITANNGFDWNTDYTKKFDKEGQEFSVAVQYSKQNSDQDNGIIEDHVNLKALNRDSKIVNDGDNHETTIQFDYVHPFNKSVKLETGVKGVIRKIISDYSTDVLENLSFRRVSDIYEYDQDVYAGYASLNFYIMKKIGVNAGLRYESTGISGQSQIEQSNSVKNNYGNILPSITLSRTFPKFRTLKVAYTRRIQRPGLQFINPFNNTSDFLNRVEGNPYLSPELVDQIELSYNITFWGITTFSSVYYKNTKDIIEQVLLIDNTGLSKNTFQNIGKNQAFGLNTFVSKTINLFTFRTGGNIYSYDASGVINGTPIARKSYEYNLFFNGEFKFTGTLKADFFGFFRSPVRTIQGDNPAFTIYGMGIRKEFKKSSIGLTLIEPFNEDKFFRSNVSNDQFTQKSSFSIPFRSIGINYRLKFGNVDFKERKSKVKNTDIKQGNDNQNQGMPTNNNQ
ncbi:MAG: TonB-dependent receptor [Saprospiraceae bacterium]|nr:TonB-dependent receptor [Saprospiraceae bacterium]